MDSIHLITTGGTIDKIYNPITGNLDVGSPVVLKVLEKAGYSPQDFVLSRLFAKDSLDMTEEERDSLALYVAQSVEQRIVITHGTDTMGASAQRIEQMANSKNKTIVLTGAMVPYSVDETEAAFNIGVALYAARTLPSGVFIAMHGIVSPHTRFIKNRALGKFIEQA